MEKNLFNVSFTENGMLTYTTSGNPLYDLFSVAGASRNKSEVEIERIINDSFDFDKQATYKLLHYIRDPRFGLGERRFYRIALRVMIKKYSTIGNLYNVGEYGRWDDLFDLIEYFNTFKNDNIRPLLRKLRIEIPEILNNRDIAQLFTKWMPRKGIAAKILRNLLNLTPKEYRVLVSHLSRTVEQQMSEKLFKEIDFSKVPALASLRYSKAFLRNAPYNYEKYLQNLKENKIQGNVQIKFPHEITRLLKDGDNEYAQIAWNNLPNFYDSDENRVLPIIDVSGSMDRKVSGSITAMDIAITLGIYLSERLKCIYKNKFITFSDTPQMLSLQENSNIYEKIQFTKLSNWGMSTNIEGVFDLILKLAVRHKLEENVMPTHLIIITDMEFNRAAENTAMDLIRLKYENSGYKLPKLIFWNVNSKTKNMPVLDTDKNAIMVSGYSTEVLRSLFMFDNFDYNKMINDIISLPRYSQLEI